MPNPLLQPGDIPRPWTAAERRKLAAAETDNRRNVNVRPNVPYSFDRVDACAMSKYSTHRFTANFGRTCTFCLRDYKDCVVKKEAR